MNNRTEGSKSTTHILESRVGALQAELAREWKAERLLAWVSLVLALIAVGFSFGFGSLVFILLTLAFAIFLAVYAFSLWCLRSNLKDSMSLLQEIRSQEHA